MVRYGVGILGAGWVAGEYVRVFRDHPQCEIAGVYNRTPGKAARLLAEHGVEAREYASEDELFDDERVQIVVSCTPPDPRPEHIVTPGSDPDGRRGKDVTASSHPRTPDAAHHPFTEEIAHFLDCIVARFGPGSGSVPFGVVRFGVRPRGQTPTEDVAKT